MGQPSPLAFMSYARVDDKHEEGRLSEFRERFSAEVKMQTGEEFPIFQDRNDIKWGENWKERIEGSLDEVTFLIPIITPSFFKSPTCRDEVLQFLEREAKLKRNDLILPVYYVDCPLLADEAKRATDPVAQAIAEHNWADWRELRFESLTSPEVRKTLAQLAVQVRDALDRIGSPPVASAKRRRRRTAATGRPATSASGRGRAGRPSPVTAQTRESAAESGVATRGPAAKTEPPVHVVDSTHRGDFSTITDAINAAQPGDRILVRRGVYTEGLVIDKPLEIIGQGEAAEVEVHARGQDALLFKTTMGRVANLSLRQMGMGKWHGVDIAQGRLDLEECDITSQSLSCIVIHGGADPRLRGNQIHDSKQGGGVVVYENGQGTLEDNEIFANALAGITIRTGANPTIRRNRIHGSKQGGGIFIHENGQGTLEDNEIFANALAGIAIKTGGNPTIRRNRINRNGYQGVWVYDSGAGTVEENDLRENSLGAWLISEDSELNVKRRGNVE